MPKNYKGCVLIDGKSEFILTLMSSFFQEESRSISENCTWGQKKDLQMRKRIFYLLDFKDMTGEEEENLLQIRKKLEYLDIFILCLF